MNTKHDDKKPQQQKEPGHATQGQAGSTFPSPQNDPSIGTREGTTKDGALDPMRTEKKVTSMP